MSRISPIIDFKKAVLLILGLAIICGFGVLYFFYSSPHTIMPAESVAELEIGIQYREHLESIGLWHNSEENIYYYFLPSGCMDRKINFCNAPANSLWMDEILIDESTDLRNVDRLLESVHSLKMNSDDSLALIQVRFMVSDGISAMFFHMEEGVLEQIQSDKDKKAAAKLYAVDENSKCTFDNEIGFIKCRGVSSFAYSDKKQYTIKLQDDAKLLGMTKGDKWVLQGNGFDNSRVRNKLAFDYASNYSDIESPESKYADVYVNGEYIGNYLVCQHKEDVIKPDKWSKLEKSNKIENPGINLDEAKHYSSEDGKINSYTGLRNPKDITGGYLIETGGSMDAACSFVTKAGVFYEVLYPEHATREEVEYICNFMNETEAALAADDGINPLTLKHYSEYIDVDSWAEKYVIDVLFGDTDKTMLSYGGRSMFFYKPSDKIDSHIYATIPWDYDSSFGETLWLHDNIYFDNPSIKDGKNALYAEQLAKQEGIMEKVKQYYSEVANIWVEDNMSAYLRDLTNTLEQSLKMDYVRWPMEYGRYTTLEANADYIRWYLKEHSEFLNDLWINEANYHTVTFLGPSGEIIDSYQVRDGETITYTPSVSSYEGIFAGWRIGPEDKVFVPTMPIYEDLQVKSTWYNNEIFMLNILGSSGMDVQDIDMDTLKKLVRELEKAKEKDADSK